MLKLLIEEMSKYMKNFDEELFTKAYYIARCSFLKAMKYAKPLTRTGAASTRAKWA